MLQIRRLFSQSIRTLSTKWSSETHSCGHINTDHIGQKVIHISCYFTARNIYFCEVAGHTDWLDTTYENG